MGRVPAATEERSTTDEMSPEEMAGLVQHSRKTPDPGAVARRRHEKDEVSVVRPVLKIADDAELDAFMDGTERPSHLDE